MLWKALLLIPFISLLFAERLYWESSLSVSVALLFGWLFLPKVFWLQKLIVYALVFTASLSYSHFRADLAVNKFLPGYLHGAVVSIRANIVSPVKTVYAKPDNKFLNETAIKKQFTVEVQEAGVITNYQANSNHPLKPVRPGQKLRLSYYPATDSSIGKKSNPLENINTLNYGTSINAIVKLREIEGFSVPGGFDLRRHALANNISGFGTVTEIYLHNDSDALSLGHLYKSIRKYVIESVSPFIDKSAYKGIYYALLFGQKSSLDSDLDELLIKTGTRHLLAVSGLHIGICILFSGLIARPLLSYLVPPGRRGRSNRTFIFTVLASVAGGFAYLCIAAFPVSGIRAFVMASIALIVLARGKQGSLLNNLLFAAVIILLIDPLTILSNGFWLSFIAVALLCWGLKNTSNYQAIEGGSTELVFTNRVKQAAFRTSAGLVSLFFCQWVLFIGMSLIYAPLGIDGSMLAIAANMLMVPIYSLFIIPLCFIGLLSAILAELSSISGCASASLLPSLIFYITDTLVSFSLDYLRSLVYSLDDTYVLGFGVSIWPLPIYLLATGFVLIHLKGRRIPGFWVSTLAIISIYLPVFSSGTFLSSGNLKVDRLQRQLGEHDVALTQIDVGQGSAYLISTRNEHWLYDTGASFRFGGDAASFSILPLLRHYNIYNLEAVVISHGDNDHIGGFASLQNSIRFKHVYASDLGELTSYGFPEYKKCEELEGINLNKQITLRSLWPLTAIKENAGGWTSDNDNSCVIQLCMHEKQDAKGNRLHCPLLLTGDIGIQAEKALVATQREKLRSDIFTVPHHGSNSSSSHVFLDTVAPQWGLLSSGRHNRYGHPHDKVLQRLSTREILTLDSAIHGTVQMIYRVKNRQWEGPYCSRYRKIHFWQNPATGLEKFCEGGLI